MIDYLYLLDYEADMHTELRIVEGEGAAAADLRIEDFDVVIRGYLRSLQRFFPQFGVQECFEALIRNRLKWTDAHSTLLQACYDKKKKGAEALM